MSDFRLFPEGRRWWSLSDYGLLLELVRRIRPRRVLEFGPGSSTLALIEGGAQEIVTLEDDHEWSGVWARELRQHGVRITPYFHTDPLSIPEVDDQRFDFGFVDGPRATALRGAEIAYAARRCRVIACHDAHTDPVRAALAKLTDRSIEYLPSPSEVTGGYDEIAVGWPR